MDRTKRLAMFNDDDDNDGPSFQSKPLDQQKLSQFTANTVRKSKREKEAEAAEAKRREEEEHAAKAYADFLDAFDAPSGSNKGGTGFVRSSIGTSDASKVYNPLTGSRVPRKDNEMAEVAAQPASAPKPKGKRAMDSFLEEIKREQAEREERHKRMNVTHSSATAMAAFETQRGSRDTGDPETTNIFVANLPQNITEDTLGHFFAQNGPVGSVKIMWPRGDNSSGVGGDITSSRKSRSAGLSGFVQFMKRKDAENCVREMDGFDWGGSVLRVGWSKAVPLAPRALYERTQSRSPPKDERPYRNRRSQSYSRSRSRSRSPRRNRDSRRTRDRHDRYSDRDRERERDRDYGPRRDSRSRSYSHSRSPEPYRHHRHHSNRRGDRSHGRHRSRSRSPSRHRIKSYSRSRSRDRRSPTRDVDYATRMFIRTVAQDCKNHGKEYEDTLREREKGNPKYTFMWKNTAPGYQYFKSLRSEAIKPTVEFDDDGSQTVWSTDSAEESEKERTVRKEILGKLAKKRLEALLRRQTGRREDMAHAMVFCIDHAHAAPQIADTIIASLLVDTTAVPRKVARLHLICDILHNSAISVHKAWKFRQEFQARLPLVFDHLGTIYHSFPGRMTAEIFKKQILSVVEVWEDWLVFPLDFTQELRTRLEGDVEASVLEQAEMPQVAEDKTPPKGVVMASSKFKTLSFKPAAEPEDGAHGAERAATDDIDGEPVDGEDLDGMPLDGDVVNAEPLDGEPFDGEPLDGEPLDGEPLDGGPFDGEPLYGEPLDGQPSDADPLGTKSTEIPHGNAERQGEDSDVPMEMDEDSD